MSTQRVAAIALCFLLFAQDGEANSRRRDEGARPPQPRLSAFWQHTCLVQDDASVRCWGANQQGQIGNGAVAAAQGVPVSPTGLFGVATIAAGRDHTCALVVGGAQGSTVKCWGDNEDGQLGDGSTTDRTTPVAVQGLIDVIAVTAGDDHSCALKVNGSVHCWGYNGVGNLGIGSTVSRSTPVQVPNVAGAIAISAGSGHTCALLAAGGVKCWGWNIAGQIGDGTAQTRLSPVSISGLSGVVALAAGSLHTCALLASGTGQCWGSNLDGQIGDGTTSASRSVPTSVNQLNNAIGIAAGSNHSCAVRSNGTVSCWGGNGSGQLGDGFTARRLDASTTVLGVANIVEVTAGSLFSCAVDAAGVGRCWGANSSGQLGNGLTSPSLTATTVSGVAGSIGARKVVTGDFLGCAQRGNGTASCWGSDLYGKLGNGGGFFNFPQSEPQNSSSPVPVSLASNVVSIHAGGFSSVCMVRASGGASCWGNNTFGQLGDGTTAAARTAPMAVQGLADFLQIAPGRDHTCALIVDGTVFCWGGGELGQLGDGSFLPSSLTPVQVSGLSGAVAVASGNDHTCALAVDSTIWCWGENFQGQLGNGTQGVQTRSATPVQVAGLSSAVAITAGPDHTCAILADGTGRCWGDNDSGQLGNGTVQDRTTPDIVVGLNDATAISAGLNHSCAVRARGSASCWGQNTQGELAASDLAEHLTPTTVIQSFTTVQGVTIPVALATVTAISAGPAGFPHTCVLLISGQPRCWGTNGAGQLGDGTQQTRLRPTIVPSFTANVDTSVTLRPNGRIAGVTALVNCEVDSRAQIFVSLSQGDVVASGVAVEVCAGMLEEIPMNVAVHGRFPLQAGPATANLEAIVRSNGVVTEHQFWTRQVTLDIEP